MTTDQRDPGDAAGGPAAVVEHPAGPLDLRPAEKRRPNRAVPTERISFPKQLDLLRAYAAISGLDRRAVSLAEVARVVNMTASTASLANAFFVDVGLLEKQESGFVPSTAAIEYHQAHEWEGETAAQKLAPTLADSWAWDAVEGSLAYAPQSENEIVRLLAAATSASKHYEPQLRSIVTYFEAAGLVVRDGNTLRLARRETDPAQKRAPGPKSEEANEADQKSEPSKASRAPSGGGFGGPPVGSTVHPALVGLLQLLPPARTPWRQGKKDWILAFTATIDAIYPEADPLGDDEEVFFVPRADDEE